MTIHLIAFASILHKQASLRSSHEAILSELEKYYTVRLIDYQDMDKLNSDDFKIILSLPEEWKDWLSSISNVCPDLPFVSRRYAELTCCSTGNINLVARKGNEERNSSW